MIPLDIFKLVEYTDIDCKSLCIYWHTEKNPADVLRTKNVTEKIMDKHGYAIQMCNCRAATLTSFSSTRILLLM